jgi:hypothetical protein
VSQQADCTRQVSFKKRREVDVEVEVEYYAFPALQRLEHSSISWDGYVCYIKLISLGFFFTKKKTIIRRRL